VPRPRSLTPEQIGAAGLSVVDREGLDALTMRAVAEELGVSTMGLYRYVTDRLELEALVLERALTDLATSTPDGAAWTDRLSTLLLRVRAALAGHPHVVPLTMRHRQRSPTVLRWTDAVAGILTEAGFTGAGRVVALRCISAYAVGAIQLAYAGPLDGAGTAAMAALPAGEFPHLADTARDAMTVDPEEEFRGGIAVLLAGLGTALAPRHDGGKRPQENGGAR
jgi:AcrR family transcriptional regulator